MTNGFLFCPIGHSPIKSDDKRFDYESMLAFAKRVE